MLITPINNVDVLLQIGTCYVEFLILFLMYSSAKKNHYVIICYIVLEISFASKIF